MGVVSSLVEEGCDKFALFPHIYFCIVMEFFSAKLNQCLQDDLISTPYKKGDCTISHLFFADDVMIFCNANVDIANNIKKVLQDLFLSTGL